MQINGIDDYTKINSAILCLSVFLVRTVVYF